jgi:hypothetical protein
MRFEAHPLSHVLPFFKDKQDAEIQFSIYEYQPQSVFDTRTFIDVLAKDADENWVAQKLGSLSNGEELAFHSVYKKGKRKYHLPMIDFDCGLRELDYAKDILYKVLPNHIYSGLVFFESGRSLHAYGSTGLSNKQWVDFMGRLLLANLPNKPSIVDTRWVGHRLMGGFSSLRWSSNSGMYLKIPTHVY